MEKIKLQSNSIFKQVHQSTKRYIVIKGSAGSGKSVDTAQQYILRLMNQKGRNLVTRQSKFEAWALANQANLSPK